MCMNGFCKGAMIGFLLGAAAIVMMPAKRERCMKKQARRSIRSMEKAIDEALDSLGGMME